MPPLTPDGSSPHGTTGRFLVLFAEGATRKGIAALTDAAGIGVEVSDEVAEPESGGGLLLEELNVVVIDAPPDQLQALSIASETESAIIAVEPERFVYAIELTKLAPPGPVPGNGIAHPVPVPLVAPQAPEGLRSPEYLRGFRDAVLHLTPDGTVVADAAAEAVAAAVDESQATWGLQAVKAVNSCQSGRGIKLAVLDTGMDLAHPDFQGRAIKSQSFIEGEAVQDLQGHGTHCIGTAAGPKCGPTRPRYGVAYEAEIFAGKVLSNAGSGTDRQILAGINWAIRHKCEVISMSLGASVAPGDPFNKVYEAVAKRASARGSLILAAAGNDSARPSEIRPVSHPANCPSIMAVAALNSDMGIAWFSNRGIDPNGGQVDVAGPGVSVYSTVPMPARYGRKNGTSMATPHAAGVAALLAESDPNARGAALGRLLTGTARRLEHLSSADVGAGLVQAP